MGTSNSSDKTKELYRAGISHFQSGNLSVAKDYFTKVLKIDPNHSKTLNNLGVIAYSENKVEEAEYFFHQAFEADSVNYEAAANLANLYFTEKNYDKAKKLFVFLTQKEPGNHEYFLKLGDCYSAFAEYTTAYNIYKKAGKLNPKDVRTIKRMNLIAAALTPLPFSVSGSYRKEKIKIGYGNGLEHIEEFEKYPFIDTFKIEENTSKEITPSNPPDFLIVRDYPLLFKDNLPALCKILILSRIPQSLDLNESQRLNNIDYVFCREKSHAEKLISEKTFAEYQVKIIKIEDDSFKNALENTWNCLNDHYIEMVLFYADVLELQDRSKQAHWILQKVSAYFPDDLRISERYKKEKRKIDHWFEPGSNVNIYVESGEKSMLDYNISLLKRFIRRLN